jgi:hypothetical protein
LRQRWGNGETTTQNEAAAHLPVAVAATRFPMVVATAVAAERRRRGGEREGHGDSDDDGEKSDPLQSPALVRFCYSLRLREDRGEVYCWDNKRREQKIWWNFVLFRAQENDQIQSSFNGGGCWLGERDKVPKAAAVISNFTTAF